MKNMISLLMRITLTWTACTLCAGCVVNAQKTLVRHPGPQAAELKAPTRHDTLTKTRSKKRHMESDQAPSALASNIAVTKEADVPETLAELEKTVLQCQGFLHRFFGPPRYQGKITIIFTTDPRDNGRMVWKKSQAGSRRILLNSINVYRDSQSTLWDVIVHEMFHALYQTPQLITSAPKFVLEAQASYAQKMAKEFFITGTPSSDRVYADAKRRVAGLRCESDMILDPDTPFAGYGQCSTDKLYLLGALLFATEGNRIPAVKKTLVVTSATAGVRSWIKTYRLAVPPPLQRALGISIQPQNNLAGQRTRQPSKAMKQNKEIQQVLSGLGYYNGPIDGLLGSGSRKAIRIFQQKRGLKPSGLLDEETLGLMWNSAKKLGLL